MTIWKKAISAVTSAALLASLLATSAFAVKGTAPDADLTDYLNCASAANVAVPATCSQVADGVSTVTLVGEAKATGTNSLYIAASGASIIGVGPAVTVFTLAGGIVTTAVGAVITANTITLRAPAAAGTAVVSVFEIAQGTGIATLEGTLTITFTATSGLAVSEANSIVKFVAVDAFCGDAAVSAAQPKGLNPAAKLCVYVGNVNAQAVKTAEVTAQIQPVGLLSVGSALAGLGTSPAGTLQVQTTAINTVDGWYAFGIGGSGLSGVGTVGVSVKLSGVTTTFAPKTFTFSDTLATLTATQTKYAVAKPVLPALPSPITAFPYNIATVAGKDAAGNAVACDTGWVAKSGTVAVLPDPDVVVTADGKCQVHILAGWTAQTLGSTAITVQNAAGTIKAAPFTFYVSDVAATVTVVFGVPTIAAGGSTTITVEAKDAGGRPVADDTATALIVSAGAFTPAAPKTSNGKAVVTYLAPFNFGAVTALATVDDITKSGSANVGVPAVVTTLGSTASTLGVAPPGGSWSTSTKVAKVGSFITWRFAAGVANAGKTIGVFLQTRDANGVWSAPVRFSARVADSSGNAYFSWRSSSALWVSIRGGLDAARSNPPVQGRWVN